LIFLVGRFEQQGKEVGGGEGLNLAVDIEPELFQQQLPGFLQRRDALGENYRTVPPMPLEIIDRVFAYVFDPVVHGLDLERNAFEVAYQPLRAGLPSTGAEHGEVTYIVPQLPDVDEEYEEEEERSTEERPAEERPTEAIGLPQVRMVVDRLAALHGVPRLAARGNESAILRWADMAVLLPSRDVVLTELEREFRRRGVPFLVHKGIGFWQRQEVADVVGLASWLADPGDDIGLLGTLRGPIGQLPDGEILFLSQLGRGRLSRGVVALAALREDLADVPGWETLTDSARLALSEHWQTLDDPARAQLCRLAQQLESWRRAVDRRPHAELLQTVLEASGAYAIYGADEEAEAIFANLAKLFDFIRDDAARAPGGLAPLARRLRERVNEAEKEEQAPVAAEADAVQIMTVHAAKGLEFPVVAVMKLERRAARATGQRLRVSVGERLLASNEEEMGTPAAGKLGVSVRHPRRPREMYVPRLLKALADLDRAQALAESRRLFYVAATRARERLILAGKEPRLKADGTPMKMQESWQRWFEEALGITREDRARGLWEDVKPGHRVAILTTPAGSANAAPAPAVRLTARLDLEALAAAAAPDMLRADTFLGRVLDTPLDLRSPRLIGRLVRRILTTPPTAERGARLDADLLRRWALDMALLDDDPLPPEREAIRRAANAAAECEQRLERDAASASRVRALMDADGEEDVPYRLCLGTHVILGRFDRLLRRDTGYEAACWVAEGRGGEEYLTLLALGLWRTGRAALNEGRVIVHRLPIGAGEVRAVGWLPDRLEALAADWCNERGASPGNPAAQEVQV
jgi:hypothetical protein